MLYLLQVAFTVLSFVGNSVGAPPPAIQASFSFWIYGASHSILDYLQALTPKYTNNTRKAKYFLQENV